MNVVLIGFRCAGKSCVGRALGKRLNREFLDCDEYIERKTNLTIREIFDIAGESYFRMLEGDAIAEVSKRDGLILATGGGAALRYKNIHLLKRNGVVVFLEVGAESAFQRSQGDPSSPARRPSLTGRDPFEEMREQVEFRRPYYLNAADFVVRTDGRSVDDIVQEILLHLKEPGGEEPPPPDEGDVQLA